MHRLLGNSTRIATVGIISTNQLVNIRLPLSARAEKEYDSKTKFLLYTMI
jgi:hypothetical protein